MQAGNNKAISDFMCTLCVAVQRTTNICCPVLYQTQCPIIGVKEHVNQCGSWISLFISHFLLFLDNSEAEGKQKHYLFLNITNNKTHGETNSV